MQRSSVNGGYGDEATEIAPVPASAWTEFVEWIDPLRHSSEVLKAVEELVRRASSVPGAPQPLQALSAEERVAGAYVLMMGAKVASVGGVRAVDNHTVAAAQLLEQLVTDARSLGAVQIQAVVGGDDSALTSIVEVAGFTPLAELQQLWLPLHPPNEPVPEPERVHAPLPIGLKWVAAKDVPREEMAALLGQTFIETLDCPSLNGLRSSLDILDGFLDGQLLTEQSGWWLLERADKLVGCSLINALPNGAGELVYLGLVPGARGRGFGKYLLDQAVVTSLQLACEAVLAAVDCDNWPAIRMYAQRGFQERGRVQAWFHEPHQR